MRRTCQEKRLRWSPQPWVRPAAQVMTSVAATVKVNGSVVGHAGERVDIYQPVLTSGLQPGVRLLEARCHTASHATHSCISPSGATLQRDHASADVPWCGTPRHRASHAAAALTFLLARLIRSRRRAHHGIRRCASERERIDQSRMRALRSSLRHVQRITNALIVPGDLPLITSESITALLQSAHLQHRG